MARNRTRSSDAAGEPRALDPTQLVALEALSAGRTIADAAECAGVSRTTVHRWLKDDYAFRAEVNAARHALKQAAMARLDGLCDRAIDVLRQSLEQSNDPRIALEVLKGTGLLGSAWQVGTLHAEVLEAEERAEQRSRLSRAREHPLFL
jgi:hypothetical protein